MPRLARPFCRLLPMALVAAALAGPVAAQITLVPGSPELADVPPQTTEYQVRLTGQMERTIGRVEIAEQIEGDRVRVLVHLSVPMNNQSTRDTTVLALPGLTPVSYASHASAEEFERVRADGGRLVGRYRLGNLVEDVDAALPADVFGPGTRGRLVRALPFVEGYTATVRMADGRGTITTDTLRVLGTRPFTRPDGTETTAWEVVVSGSTLPRTTYAVDAVTRQLWSTRYTSRPGIDVEVATAPPPPTGPVVRPADPQLDLGRLGAEEATFELRVVEPVQMAAGQMTVRRTIDGDALTTVTTLTVPMQNVNQTTTAVADRATLAPRRTETTGSPTGDVAMVYADGRVSGTRTPAGQAPEPFDRALDAPAFDAAWVVEVIQALPLAEGFTAEVATFDADNGAGTVNLRVTGQTEVDGAAAWTVEATSASGVVTYTVDAATRELLRMRLRPQPGVVIEMIRS